MILKGTVYSTHSKFKAFLAHLLPQPLSDTLSHTHTHSFFAMSAAGHSQVSSRSGILSPHMTYNVLLTTLLSFILSKSLRRFFFHYVVSFTPLHIIHGLKCFSTISWSCDRFLSSHSQSQGPGCGFVLLFVSYKPQRLLNSFLDEPLFLLSLYHHHNDHLDKFMPNFDE